MTISSIPTVESLMECGLPEAQAKASVEALTSHDFSKKPSTTPASVHITLKLKEGSSEADIMEALTAYGTTAKTTPGKIFSDFSIHNGEILHFEIMESPEAMDAHIGLCFPHYAKMTAHIDVVFIRGVVDPSQVKWWTHSCSPWGGDLVIAPSSA